MTRFVYLAPLLLAAAILGVPGPDIARAGITPVEIVSIWFDGSVTLGEEAAISGDGRWVAFQAEGQILARDRENNTTFLVSSNPDGPYSFGNGVSERATVSGDGRLIAFSSAATDLVPGDTNSASDIFLRDMQTGTIERIGTGVGGAEADGGSSFPDISANGRFIAFTSSATNLVDPPAPLGQAYLYDRLLETTTLVSVATDGTRANDGIWFDPAVANNGDVAFWTDATNLVPDDTNGEFDVFVHTSSGVTSRVSVGPGNVESNDYSTFSDISDNGQFVAFGSRATNLDPADTNGFEDTFIHDMNAGTTALVSLGDAGQQGNGNSGSYGTISGDGTVVAFFSDASNLTSDDPSIDRDTFLRDLKTGSTNLLAPEGGSSNFGFFPLSMNTIGTTVLVDWNLVYALGCWGEDADGDGVPASCENESGARVEGVIAIDATGSMGSSPCNSSHNNSGCPIWEAKGAAISLSESILSGGDAAVGIAPFRGCYDPPNPYSGCIDASLLSPLSSDQEAVTAAISAIHALGGTGTNVCLALDAAHAILVGPESQGGEQVLVILTDADNTYNNTSYASGTPGSPPEQCRPDTSPSASDVFLGTGCSAPGQGSASGSNPGSTSATRERELDLKTDARAGEIKMAGVEIFVVAFGICGEDDGVLPTPGYCAGIGNTEPDTVADQRLAKCVASSTPGTNDHYLRAESAEDIAVLFGAVGTSVSCLAAPTSDNNDDNLIELGPHYAMDDMTRPLSDRMDDVCDPDDDNDGLADEVETAGPPCASASGSTDPFSEDSDADGVLDGAECLLRADPASDQSTPLIADCAAFLGVAATTDTDGDLLRDPLEFCFYNTDPRIADSDGDRQTDGATDGCEVTSLNTDRKVNSGDQLLLAQEILRVLGAGDPNAAIDLNKDGGINSGDQLLMAFYVVLPSACPG